MKRGSAIQRCEPVWCWVIVVAGVMILAGGAMVLGEKAAASGDNPEVAPKTQTSGAAVRKVGTAAPTKKKPPIQPSLTTKYDIICTNKANFPRDKSNANLFAAKDYENKPPRPTRKNKPNQPQSPRPQ